MSVQAHFNTHYGTYSSRRSADITARNGLPITVEMPQMAHSSHAGTNLTTDLTTMEAQHIFHIATIEAENRSLVAQNHANQKIIEFLLAQLVQASNAQAPSSTIENASPKANPPAACIGVNSFGERTWPDTQPGPDYYRKPLTPQLRVFENGPLDDYWNSLTPHSSADVNDSRPVAKPAESDMTDWVRPLVISHAAVPPNPKHPAMQASAKPETDRGFDEALITTRHKPETRPTSSGPDLRKFPVGTLYKPEMRAESSPFMPIGYTLRSAHSIERPRLPHVESDVAYGVAEEKQEIRSLLMYQPVEHDSDTKRTVVITGFPLDGKLSDLLNQVHTGLVYSITVNDTSTISDHATVVLIFLRGEAARTLVGEATAKRMTVPDTHGVDHVLNFRMLESATYPIPGWLYRRVTEQGATRVVRVSGLPAELTCQAFTSFVCECGTRRHGLASISKDDNGNFVAEFTSVPNALKAVERLFSYPDFRNAIWGYLPDPCNVGVPSVGEAGEVESEESGITTPDIIHGAEMEGSKDAAQEERLHVAGVIEVDKYGHAEDLI